MCGICGIVNFEEENTVDKGTLVKMRDTMIHRGPDDEGVYLNGNVGLGFRRLSIIDLKSGHQPMCNEDGLIWLAFNGEIYNHSELRAELVSRGHGYKTKTDAESIIHLYEQEGVKGFKKMNGMFAFAIWDEREKKLVLVRDRLGIKPLYLYRSQESLIFASEIKAILVSKKVKKELNVEGLCEYFMFRFLAGEQTMFSGITSLLPGQVLVFQRGKIETKKFWDLPNSEEIPNVDERGAINRLDELLSDSVRLRLMSDVPLGTFCSGGVDSSLTSAYAARLSDSKLNTFSVGFHETAFDESRYAAIVSEKYGTRHHRLIVDNIMFADSLPKLIWHNDEPLNHANSVQIYHISKLSKQFVTVVLTGEGADELFAGYPRYLIAGAYQNFFWMPQFARYLLRELSRWGYWRRVKKLGQFLPLSLPEATVLNSCFTDWSSASRILSSSNDLESIIEYRLSLLGDLSLTPKNTIENLIRLELKTYLVSILNRQDKMSMAASVEARVPFLDYRLVEWALKIPIAFKMKGFQTKSIVKKLGERMLPKEIVHRKKSGFGVPISSWLRDKKGMGRYLDLFSEPKFEQRDYLETQMVQRLAQEHVSGKADNGEILWGLINLELWHRIFLDGG